MQMYYFKVRGLPPESDPVGEELKDDVEAWNTATTFVGEVFKDVDGRLLPGQEWSLEVADAKQKLLYVIHVSSQAKM